MSTHAPLIVVATLMGGEGPTGVETHFNNVLRHAEAIGYSTRLITPYTGPRLRRAVFRILKNKKSERAGVLYRRGQGWLIQSELNALRRTFSARRATLYAQCPTSAQAALAVSRPTPAWKTVMVAHFNISEAREMAQKGTVQPDGAWCRHLDALEASVLPRLDKIIFVSDCMKRIVNERVPSISGVRQETIFNFPPPPKPAPNTAMQGDLITIGTLEPRKNQGFQLRVLAEAKARGFKYTLAIVGNGPDRAALERQVREAGLEGQVTFLGFRANAGELIPAYRCLSHSSVFESGGITVLEALSHGRPVLAAPVGGIPEHFSNGEHGVYWDLEDPVKAARDLIDLLESPEKYTRMSAAAHAHYVKVFAPLPNRWVASLVEDATGRAPSS